jgi:predicted ArsR family transcriptional regulator
VRGGEKLARKFDNVRAEVLKQLGKKKGGLTAEELCTKLEISKDYALAQVKALREEGKVERVGGRVPKYKVMAAA